MSSDVQSIGIQDIPEGVPKNSVKFSNQDQEEPDMPGGRPMCSPCPCRYQAIKRHAFPEIPVKSGEFSDYLRG
jgi:hypothetical protein